MIHYRRLLPILLALAAVALFARLGVWQLQRAQEARRIEQAATQASQAPPQPLDAGTLIDDPDRLRWRRVQVRGTWRGERQVLLDNQVADGVAGYYVYTPLEIPRCGCALLVNRGWVPVGLARDRLPALDRPSGSANIRGIAAPAPAAGFGGSGAVEPLRDGVLRAQRIDAPQLSARIGLRILPLTVLLANDEPGGFRREWRPPAPRADRHLAYALQWFLFAAIAAGLAIVLNSRAAR